MKVILKISLAGLLAITFFVLQPADEAKAQAGKTVYNSKGCAGCHGPDGKAPIMPIYPKLAGQNSGYTLAQLQAFKSMQRKGGQSALMYGMAAQLSDAEMKQVADYLATVK